ncbi:Uu.00g025500.m01.CDS01 [Anthostomella pinea]|uniref:Uu.00g025500.m01.CDS01 n=1 Tax=Anthostomella pinea TaxID=933095 RepID=A0AAI8YCI2_9PEZI|nr:Uu.00g025500.m01.CDS01 [Anthostomella pinea]
MAKSIGTFRAWYLVALCCTGSFLFAYDTGVVGGVLSLASFQHDFKITSSNQSSVSSNATSLLQAGAFFSCFFVWPFTARFGRRWSLVIASIIFNIGAIVQTINTHSLAAFYVARVISGIGTYCVITRQALRTVFPRAGAVGLFHLFHFQQYHIPAQGRRVNMQSCEGVGMATVIIPMFSAEMAPKQIRGQLGSMFQFFFTLGVMTSYWIDVSSLNICSVLAIRVKRQLTSLQYAVSEHLGPTTRQWQIPIGLQLVPGGILGLGMLLTKESTRWLAKTGQTEKAMESLVWVRGENSTEVQEEFAEIIAGIHEEERVTEGLTWKECMLPANRFRFIIVITLQIGVQLTGNTSLAYFAPQIFKAVGAGDQALLISGFFGVVKVVSCLFFLLFLVERVGRRGSLLGGASLMGAYMLIIACLTATHPPKAGQSLTSTGAAAVAMVYLEAMSYNISWGPVPWLYMSEIFPSRIREAGVAVGTATQWLFNFVFSQITPHAINNIGWRTFLMFCIFNWSLVVYTWFFIRETKGKSLEEMEAVFGSSETAIDVEKVHEQARNLMDDVLISNLPPEQLRSALRMLVSQGSATQQPFVQHVRQCFTAAAPALTAPTLLFAGPGEVTADCRNLEHFVTSVRLAEARWPGGSELAGVLHEFGGDMVQAVQALKESKPDINSHLEEQLVNLLSSMRGCRTYCEEAQPRPLVYPFARSERQLLDVLWLWYPQSRVLDEAEPGIAHPPSDLSTSLPTGASVETMSLGPFEMPRLFNGLWQMSSPAWGSGTVADQDTALVQLVEKGLTATDMADHYGDAELVYGDFRNRLPLEVREHVYAATKWCVFGPVDRAVSNDWVLEAVKERCRRLGGRVELLQFHWYDYAAEEYLDILVELMAITRTHPELVGAIGLCNFDSEHARQACEYLLAKTGVVGLVSNQIQCGGFLSSKWLGQPMPEVYSESSRFTPSQRKARGIAFRHYLDIINHWGSWQEFQGLLRVLSSVAIIVGTRLGITAHVDDNLAVFDFTLDEEDLEVINRAALGTGRKKTAVLYEKLGDCGNEYRGTH